MHSVCSYVVIQAGAYSLTSLTSLTSLMSTGDALPVADCNDAHTADPGWSQTPKRTRLTNLSRTLIKHQSVRPSESQSMDTTLEQRTHRVVACCAC